MATAKPKAADSTKKRAASTKQPSVQTTAALAKATTAKSIVSVKKSLTALNPIRPKTTALAKTSSKSVGLVSQYRTHATDTGSTTVQIATVSDQIKELQKHLKTHPKDHDSRRGLLIMVGKRRRLLNYLGRSDSVTYQRLIVDLKLKK